MEPVKVGVIGAGYWGPNLIRNFAQLQSASLRLVCDLNTERLKRIAEHYPGTGVTTSLDEFLAEDIDAVAIATPVGSHYPLAMRCLQAGKHILVEKPLAHSSAAAQEIIRTASEKGLTVMTGHTFVYNPAVQALKEIIQSGEIGDVYYINSSRVNLGLYQPDTNVVWDLAPHDVSILLHILDLDPLTASARGGTFVKPGVHDFAHVTLNFPSGIMANLHVSWLDPCKIRRVTIVGNKKMIVYDDIDPVEKIKIYDKGVDVQPYTNTLEEFHLAYRYGEVINHPIVWDEPLRLECQHFVDAVACGSPTRSDGPQGLKVIQILEAAQKSLNNGGMREPIQW